MLVDLNIIRQLDAKIRRKSTGKPDILAESLGISRRQTYRYLEFLSDDCGLSIQYDKDRQSYYYSATKSVYLLRLGKD